MEGSYTINQKKLRSVGPHQSKLIQTMKNPTNNKKICQENKKSRSVSIQLPEHPRSKNKQSRSDTIQLPEKPRSVRTPKNSMNIKISIPEIEESRSEKEASTPQRMVSVAGHPKNCLYIDIGASIHIFFN